MEILKLLVVFIAVMAIVSAKKPVYVATFVGAILTWLLYAIPFSEGLKAVIGGATAWSTISLILVVYIISFLQNMMALRHSIDKARLGFSSLFNNRWVDCAAAPIFIGMLPTPNAAFIAGDIVKASASNYLDNDETAVVTSYFRHVSESFMPTYNAILTALVISGVAAGEFVIMMMPITACIIISGCFWFLRGKVPTTTDHGRSTDKLNDLKEIGIGLWAIMLVVLLVVVLKFQVIAAASIALVAFFFIHRFSFKEIRPLFKKSVQMKLYLNTISIMVFKEFLELSGAVQAMTSFFSSLPIPAFLAFALIFFFGGIVSGSAAMIALCLPAAMIAIPGAPQHVLAFIMGIVYCSAQLSPTHICLPLTADYFGISLGRLFKGSLPAVLTTVVFTIAYYLLLTTIFPV